MNYLRHLISLSIIPLILLISCDQEIRGCEDLKRQIMRTWEITDDYLWLSSTCDQLDGHAYIDQKRGNTIEERRLFFLNNPYQLNGNCILEVGVLNLSRRINKDSAQVLWDTTGKLQEYEYFVGYHGPYKDYVNLILPYVDEDNSLSISIKAYNICDSTKSVVFETKDNTLVWKKSSKQIWAIFLPSKSSVFYFNKF